MDAAYQFDSLPLDTADDDPRWREYYDLARRSLLGPPSSDEQLHLWRELRRADNARMATVTRNGRIAALVTTASSTYNAGAAHVPMCMVNTVVCDSGHRRRGLTTALLTRELAAARTTAPLAVLYASEATIYERFGFGPASREQKLTVDTQRFSYRATTPVAPGATEWIAATELEGILPDFTERFMRTRRGAIAPQPSDAQHLIGRWNPFEMSRTPAHNVVIHRDTNGSVDGFAAFVHRGWDHRPLSADVQFITALDAPIELALWQALASMDLIAELHYKNRENPLLRLAVTDERAVQATAPRDQLWLRILDLPTAIAARAFDTDGELVIGIEDAQGWIAGNWRLVVREGCGEVTPTDAEADVTLTAATLSRLWEGAEDARDLARVGLVRGDARKLGALFAWNEPAANFAHV